MSNNNSYLIGKGVLAVLDLVALRTPGISWWWHSDDIDDSCAKGTIIRTWGEGIAQDLDIAYIAAVDVTDDPTEPNISILQDEDLKDTTERLCDGIASDIERKGMRLVKWQSCELVASPLGRGLICTYITTDKGKDRQHIALRFPAHGRKTAVIACYDVSQEATLGPMMVKALQSSFVIANEPIMLGTLFGEKITMPGLYTGGTGDSIETAIIVNTKKRSVGVWAEYAYIERLHGSRNSGWEMLEQRLISGKDNRPYDILLIQLSDGSIRAYHFDISAFFYDKLRNDEEKSP